LPVLRARLAPDARARALAGMRVFAFAGIGRPSKFHATLREAGAELVGTEDYADHHPYTAAEIDRVLARADALGAVAVTTPKDRVRLPPDLPIRAAGVSLVWEDEAAIDALLRDAA
ncbi:tetraacyldisaccharide 4'-kinase, partial [Acidisphaera rubrifaciens]|uniref:tetraacyldisaccharide 4'-kinase n=1 Tax=Acidisphaera rubrifaciens TaxID=50715 RepID=UPI000662A72E